MRIALMITAEVLNTSKNIRIHMIHAFRFFYFLNNILSACILNIILCIYFLNKNYNIFRYAITSGPLSRIFLTQRARCKLKRVSDDETNRCTKRRSGIPLVLFFF